MLYVHPFAEEMNKSRRMAALQARAFAVAGWNVLLMDLHGCGDSSGDFGEATWESWQDDVAAGQAWLTARSDGPTWLWGLRVGALVAATAASRSGRPSSLLLWHPVESGSRFVQQFLRMRVMNDALGGAGERSTVDGLLALLAARASIEVAGYTVSPDLLLPLRDARMPAPAPDSIARWIEISPLSDPPAPAPPTVASWQAAGVDVAFERIDGPQFWQTQDIRECSPLISASAAMLAR